MVSVRLSSFIPSIYLYFPVLWVKMEDPKGYKTYKLTGVRGGLMSGHHKEVNIVMEGVLILEWDRSLCYPEIAQGVVHPQLRFKAANYGRYIFISEDGKEISGCSLHQVVF